MKPIQPLPNNAECERILTSSFSGVLVMSRDDEPYAVPLNHAYVDGELYFHCALQGRKLDMIRANSRVCYTVNHYFGDPADFKDGVRCHGDWESVIAYGSARVVDDPQELRSAFKTYMRYYSPMQVDISKELFAKTRAIIMTVTSMTARHEVPREGFDRRTGDGTVDISYWSWSPLE